MSNPGLVGRYLCTDLIAVNLEVSSRKKLIQKMATLLASPLPDEPDDDVEKSVYHCLLEREKLGSTGIGNGVALPHCRIGATDCPVIAIITLKNPVDYDGQTANIAVGLLVPQEAHEEHLQILATIAGFLSDSANRQALTAATSATQIMKIWENSQ